MDVYWILICTPNLTIEDGNIIGKTGLAALDNDETPVSIELFDKALSIFQQGLSLADDVCKSSTEYCVDRTIYDKESGILDIPSVQYKIFGFSAYAKAKMQQTGDNPMTFKVIEIKN